MRHTDECDAPVLRRGMHSYPSRGACLMEVCGTLPDGPWSDHPLGMDPALATLARAVNDLSSDTARQRLIAFAPWLVGSQAAWGQEGPAAIAGLVVRAALGYVDPASASRLAPTLAALNNPPDEARISRWSSWSAHRRVGRAIRSAARILSAAPDADEVLRTVLVQALNVSRRLNGLSPLPPAALEWDAYPSVLPLRVELRAPDGGDSTYFHCIAVVDRWPKDLQAGWHARVGELLVDASRRLPTLIPTSGG
jgi:hypothetical protein